MAVLVGKKAPDFTAPAVLGNNQINQKFNLSENIKGKMCVLFFYPLDFTFVCPSELIAFDNKFNEFKSRGVELIGVSVDSHFTHLAWKNTPFNKGGIGHIKYTLVADLTKSIAKDYDVLIEEAGISLRGLFLIDTNAVVRHQLINDLPLGRNVDEALRMVDALNFHEEYGEVCPAGWQRGQEGMKATAEGVAAYLGKNASKL